MVHIYNLRPWEAETEIPQAWGQPDYEESFRPTQRDPSSKKIIQWMKYFFKNEKVFKVKVV